MRNSKVIYLNKPNDRIGARIEAAARRAEENYQRKLDKSEAWDKEPDGHFSLEEFDAILASNEFFSGKAQSFSKTEQFRRLYALGRWMDAKCRYVCGISADPPSKSSRNATVRLDLALMNLLEGEAAKVYAAMAAIADDITISGMVSDREDGNRCVRVSFCLHDVWED